MGKGMPDPVDPFQAAAATSNAQTVAAGQNFYYGNPDQVSPYGTRTNQQTGTVKIYDANTGKYIDQPTFTQTTKLSPAEQHLLDLNTQMRGNLGELGVSQSARMNDLLSKSVDTSGLQAWNAGPQAPTLAKTFGGNNPMQMSVAGGGPIATGWGDSGPLQRSLEGQEIRQDQGATDRQAVEQAMMARYNQAAQPRNQAQEVELANRGMMAGGQGWDTLMGSQGDDRLKAEMDSFLASGSEARANQEAFNQASLAKFGMGAQQGAFANSAQQQADDQAARRAGFQNAAQQQQWTQNLGQGMFANSAQQQAYQQAMERAGFSNTALGQEFTMGGQAADRGNALRQNELAERLGLRNQDYNEMALLAGLSPINTPQFSAYNPVGVQAPNVGQMMYDSYNAKAQQSSDTMGGIAGMVSAVLPLLAMSDRRAKADIQPIGAELAGVPLYTFRYWTDMDTVHVGVMADEAKKVHPDAVHLIDGFDHVDYAMLRRRH